MVLLVIKKNSKEGLNQSETETQQGKCQILTLSVQYLGYTEAGGWIPVTEAALPL